MTSARSVLIVEDGGLLTTVQDTGRWGYQHYGVSVSGAMDPAAHRLMTDPKYRMATVLPDGSYR